MRRRNLILITVLSLSLTFAAGCGENKNTGAAGPMDQQKTSETTVQNETEPETSQVSEDSEQDETEAAATTEAGQDAQSDYQIEMVSYKKTDLIDISYPKITGWSDTEKQEEWNTYFENTAKEAAGEMTGDTEEMNPGANDSVVLTYTVQEQTKDMLSLTCQSYYDYEGSAHPSAAIYALTSEPYLSPLPHQNRITGSCSVPPVLLHLLPGCQVRPSSRYVRFSRQS